MRPVSLVVALFAVQACGNGPPAGAAPGPRTARVRLTFGRVPGAQLRYATREIERTGVGPHQAIQVVFDRTLFVTESFQDSLEAHLVMVHVDSTRFAGRPVRADSNPSFSAWFNDQRRRLDTLAASFAVELSRGAVFFGTVPLPPDSVKVGDRWTVGSSRVQIPHFRIPESPIHASVRGAVEEIQVVDGDTLVTLRMDLKLDGSVTARGLSNSIDVRGEETSDEVFSVRRGATVSLSTKGQVEWETAVMTIGGLRPVSSIVRLEGSQTLLP